MTKQSLADWYDEKYGKKPSAPANPTPAAEASPEPAAEAKTGCCGAHAAEPESAVEAKTGCCGAHAAEPECAEACESSLFEKLGGEAAVDAAVDIFYRKVLNDERISRFFEGVDMEQQAAKQKAFLTMAFGGPHHYTGLDMRRGHAHLVEQGLDDSHLDAVVEDLAATLTELGVPDELIGQVAAIAESTRNDVLGR